MKVTECKVAKVKGQEWSLEELQHYQGILVKTSYPEPLEAVYYQKKKKNETRPNI